MGLPILMIVLGLIILVWSADIFVDGAANLARVFGLPPLLIGMIVVGFGTSAPELSVSVLSAWSGNPELALGNAYGSNITNIALILGLTALINPIVVQSQIVRRELPILCAISLGVMALLYDGLLSNIEGWLQLAGLIGLMVWMAQLGRNNPSDILQPEIEQELQEQLMSEGQAWFCLGAGLLLLVVSSKALVWGAVSIAHDLGVSDLIIGLTVVAVGTSLPELASSIIAARKGEHDLALGNVIGSNLFNTLGVVGLASAIQPMPVATEVLQRDWPVMVLLTFALIALTYQRGAQQSSISRNEGALLLASYIAYTGYLIHTATGG
jgi:cation:H+ antiporter